MDLRDATRMILSEAAGHPDLLRVTRHAHDELALGRLPVHTDLSWMLKEAARKGLYSAVRSRYGVAAFDEMVMVIAREVDRQSPVPAR
ncbi:hypothetical protein [Actinomadura sp. GC306]|uniref:hypothetical protein n=1 Tax=Actinomadura sp. GC306 TaxID=2530367 RepID=UPI0014046E15|nr:hypothetical protein [Actinomadura sp. GC306]